MPAEAARPPLRSTRERALQTIWFEAVGLVALAPVGSLLTGSSMPDSILLLLGLSVAAMVWTALFNTAFDVVEARTTRRSASDRPHPWRVVHAIGLEVSSVVVTTPVVVALTELGWIEALLVDVALGLAYAVYGYVFHLCFDRLRPVRRTRA